MSSPESSHRLDHVVAIMFENRSFDNLLGYLYAEGEVPGFEGVAGRNLSNPIPADALGAPARLVPVHPVLTLDSPDPDPGEEFPHINTQLFGTVNPPANRTKAVSEMQAPYNAPSDPARVPTMDGFVADYIDAFRVEMHDAPRYEEYAQIMACYTPEALPVLLDAREGVRLLRPLVLRGALPDVLQPLVLPRRELLRIRPEQPPRDVRDPQRRPDDLREAERSRAFLAGLHRPGADPPGDRAHPRPAARPLLRHPLLDDLRLLRRRPEGEAARVLVHRAEHVPPAHRHASARGRAPTSGPPPPQAERHGRWGGSPRARLRCREVLPVRRGIEPLEHPVARDVRRARGDLRPRPASPGPSAGPIRPRGPGGLPVRSVRRCGSRRSRSPRGSTPARSSRRSFDPPRSCAPSGSIGAWDRR